MDRATDEITLHLDPATRDLLSRLAERENSTADETADSLFRSALRNATISPEEASQIVEAIPGAADRAVERRAEYERGDGDLSPLSELR